MINTINIEIQYLDIQECPWYNILFNEISRYSQNIEILPSTMYTYMCVCIYVYIYVYVEKLLPKRFYRTQEVISDAHHKLEELKRSSPGYYLSVIVYYVTYPCMHLQYYYLVVSDPINNS